MTVKASRGVQDRERERFLAGIFHRKPGSSRPRLLDTEPWELTNPSTEPATVPSETLFVLISSGSSSQLRYCSRQLCSSIGRRRQERKAAVLERGWRRQ